jgi:hypothetical protein
MIACQFSLYALGVEDLSPAIDAAVAEMRALGLELSVGSMSSQVSGDTDLRFRRAKMCLRGGGSGRTRRYDSHRL